MLSSRFRWLRVASLIFLSGCAAELAPGPGQPTAPAVASAPVPDGEEAELRERDRKAEAELRDRGLVYVDPSLQQYLDALTTRLAGPNAGFRVVVLRDPLVNASSASDGGIFVNAGLFTRVENEAQLAHILAHEISHTRGRHQLRSLQSLKTKTATAKIADLLSGGLLGPLVVLTHAAAVSGYGRELEQEADLQGLRMMAAAGYAPQEAERVFANLAMGRELVGVEAYFYSNHPANEERSRYVAEVLRSWSMPPGGLVNAEAYRTATRGVLLESLRLGLANRLYRTTIESIELARSRRGEDAWLDYYAGEAHRLGSADPEGLAREAALLDRRTVTEAEIEAARSKTPAERQLALECYRRAIGRDPSLALAHRGIGLAAHDGRDAATARSELSLYLRTNASLEDRPRIEKLLATEVTQ